MVQAGKFCLGDASYFMVVHDANHVSIGESNDIYTNTVNSVSIYLPWNNTVAAALTRKLRHLSTYFAIYPLKSQHMGNNILYNVTLSEHQQSQSYNIQFG